MLVIEICSQNADGGTPYFSVLWGVIERSLKWHFAALVRHSVVLQSSFTGTEANHQPSAHELLDHWIKILLSVVESLPT